MNVCYKCRKPVYFAERKTSLGKEWHPNCLRCEQCEKIVTPGQHAEHKGIPYCNPCYQALFGPQMVGYGSNVFSQANYRRSQCVPLKQDEFSNGPRLEQSDLFLTMKTELDMLPLQSRTNNYGSRQQLLNKVQAYNSFYEGKRGKLTVNEKNGSLMIEGPLRVYWQVTKPIQLKHCDDVPVPPIANWRHSYYAAIDNGLADEEQVKPHHLEMPFAKKGFDDSLLSPTSDGVVMRRRNIRKSNTVAYRAERPNKWKRASINGHIYNYDTRVFTPVIGSCTSVTVNNFMTVPSVIKTLLDKFKVENEASEFSLFVVTEHKEKRQLSDNDLPLLERLSLGPIESVAKIFLSEKEAKMQQRIVPEVEEQIVSNIAEEESCKEDGSQELSIVEQLMALPEAVLKGLLQKFMNDEEKEVAVIRARYEKARSIMQQQISEIQTSV